MRKRKNGLKKLYKPNTVFHFSIADALLNNLFEGNTSIGEILKYGDFGIGTLNGLDGEVIILDGVPYTIRGNGKAYIINNSERSPICVVTHFKEEFSIQMNTPLKYSELIKELDSFLPTENIFYPIKIVGEFKHIITRSVAKQFKPYNPIKDIANEMIKFKILNIEGTILGFKSPPFVEGIGVQGYHFHFIDKDKKVGGHLLDFEMAKGTVQFALARDFHVKLENSVDFDKLDLNESKKDLLEEIEKP